MNEKKTSYFCTMLSGSVLSGLFSVILVFFFANKHKYKRNVHQSEASQQPVGCTLLSVCHPLCLCHVGYSSAPTSVEDKQQQHLESVHLLSSVPSTFSVVFFCVMV